MDKTFTFVLAKFTFFIAHDVQGNTLYYVAFHFIIVFNFLSLFFSSYEKLCSIYGESLWNILERENLKRKEAMIIARHQLCKVQLRCLSISLFFRLEKT